MKSQSNVLSHQHSETLSNLGRNISMCKAYAWGGGTQGDFRQRLKRNHLFCFLIAATATFTSNPKVIFGKAEMSRTSSVSDSLQRSIRNQTNNMCLKFQVLVLLTGPRVWHLCEAWSRCKAATADQRLELNRRWMLGHQPRQLDGTLCTSTCARWRQLSHPVSAGCRVLKK